MARRRARRNVPKGIAHVSATFNNTIVTISDMNGQVLCWASAGTIGYKGSRKSTPFAAQRAAEAAAEKALKMGMKEVEIRVVYPGATAEEIEEVICQRVEDALDGVRFIEERTAYQLGFIDGRIAFWIDAKQDQFTDLWVNTLRRDAQRGRTNR